MSEEITYGKVNEAIRKGIIDSAYITDGYHTFSELYQHRAILFIALCKEISNNAEYQTGQKSFIWKTTKYSDGKDLEKGWFLMGIGANSGEQITYHLPMSYWSKTSFVNIIGQAPIFDKHTSDDVVKRILDL